MKLHEAIEKVLKEKGTSMTAMEIAKEINSQNLYKRRDNNPVPTSQIFARVNNYPHIFEKKEGRKIGLINSFSQTTNIDIDLKSLLQKYYNKVYYDYKIKGIEASIFVVEYFILIYNLIRKKNILIEDGDLSLNFKKVFNNAVESLNVNGNDHDLFKILIDNYKKVLSDKEFYLLTKLVVRAVANVNRNYLYKELDYFLKYSNIFKNFIVGDYTTPDFINNIMVLITSPKDNEIVYDPATGKGETLIKAYKHNNRIILLGQEKNEKISQLCRLNLFLNSVSKFNIHASDSLSYQIVKEGGANVILCNPPFGKMANGNDKYKFKRYCTDRSHETLFFEMMLSKMNSDNGRMAILVPEIFLIKKTNKLLRKYIVDTDKLEAVISLPQGSMNPYSNTKTSIILVNNRKINERRNKVLFINAFDVIKFRIKNSEVEVNLKELHQVVNEIINIYNSKKSIEVSNIAHKQISIQKISDNDYDLNPVRYTAELDQLINEISKTENLIELGQFLEIPKRSSNNRNTSENLRRVTIRELNDDENSFYLSYNKLKNTKNISGLRIVSESVLLLARIGNKLKPTYFEYKGYPIAVNSNIFIFKVDTNRINIEYLINQLNTEFVKKQIEPYREGVTIPSISRDTILKIVIPVPSLNEQLEKVKSYKKQNAERLKVVNFINEINIVSTTSEIKTEIERFAKKIFKDTEYIAFKTEYEFDFDKFPFTDKDISETKFIKNAREKDNAQYSYLLLIDDEKKINGVLILQTENEISFEQYDEINAYANFLSRTSRYINSSLANDNLARFAHTAKNFFIDLQKQFSIILETGNKKFLEIMKTEYLHDERFLKRKQKEGINISRYLAFEIMSSLSEKISSIASFYTFTDERFKNLVNESFSSFNILEIFSKEKLGFTGNYELFCSEEEVYVYAQKRVVEQAFIDLMQNAKKYSPDGNCQVFVKNKKYVEINIVNTVTEPVNKDIYFRLGKEWLASGNRLSGSGLYWARQAIENSNGSFELLPYDEHIKSYKFKVIIKLKKNI